MSEKRSNELRKLAKSRLYMSSEFIFNGKYSNDEIKVFLEEKNRLLENDN